jgi:hypothetical protein
MNIICKVCKKSFSVTRPSRLKKGDAKYCSTKCKYQDMVGRPLPKETITKMKEAQKGKNNHFFGKHHSIMTRKKLSETHRGEKHRDWKGGITHEHIKIRHSLEYRLWREAVFKRDNYTCIWCGDSRGGNLQADHIKPFAFYPELRFAIDNGRTLCIPCHKTTGTFGENYDRS